MSLTTIMDKQFALDVQKGLTSTPKALSSKYFYDKKGDALFQQIMKLEEYYPTRCEYEIFDTYKNDWLHLFQSTGKPFQLIEFGAGDGFKTKVLLDAFTETESNFQYVPIDISKNVLNILEKDLQQRYPNLDIQSINDDYFKALDRLENNTTHRKVILFLGSNIGNFSQDEAISFLTQIQKRLSKDDLILIGIDLKKNPETILSAYNDKKGVTKEFNLNLLARINHELTANFDLDKFIHAPIYNPLNGEAQSYLVSIEEQNVFIECIGETIHFEAWEAIHTEISKKYSINGISNLLEKAGMKLVKHYFDEKRYFLDTVWKK